MELSTQNAFQVIFPKYVELLSESTLPTDQSLQGFIREELPQKVQLVRSIEGTFLAFQTQFTNLILKRPKQQNLFQSLTIKASQKIQRLFSTLQSTLNKHTSSTQFSFLNTQQLRTYFRQKLKDLQQLINQKYFDNINLQRPVQEQITKRLYNLNQLYFFLKSDFTSLAAKFKVKQYEVLNEINRNGTSGTTKKEVSQLIYLQDKLMDNISEVVEKRYRPFVGKKDFFYSKLKQIQAQSQSKVPMNVTVLVQSILSKEKYRLNKEISVALSKELKLIDPTLQQQTQQQCKQIINQVDSLKRQFNQLKNNAFYLDIIRGTFSEKYKMQLNKLQNIYYLSNIEKYLQDVQTFTEKLIRVEERIIENRKGFMKKLGREIQEKIIGLVGEYEINCPGAELKDVIDGEFDKFKDALYGIIPEGNDNRKTQDKYSNAEEARRKRLQQAQDRRRELQYQKEEKQRQRRKQLEERAEKERQKRQEDKWKLQQKRRAQDERMQRMRQERELKQRQRKIEQEEKERARKIEMEEKMREKKAREKEDMQRMREESKRKEEEMKRKQEERKIREAEDAQKRERLRRQKEEEEKRKRQQLQSKRSRQQKEKKQRQQRERRQRQQRQRRQKEEKQRMLQKKRQQQQRQQRQRQEKLQRQKQERQRKQKQLKLQKQRQQEKLNRQKEQEEKRRQEQERQRRERDEKERKQRQQREKDERERKQKQRQRQLQLQKEKKQADQRQRQRLQQAQRERREREEKERRQREQRQRKQREERERKENQAREKRQKEERQQRQRKQRERERQQQQRKQKEEKLKRERQEKQRKEKEQRQKRERQQQERQRRQQEQRQLKLKQKKQQEQKQRREREQRQRKQLELLMEQQENSKKNKSKVSNDRSKKNGSGINYNDFDDILDDDMQQIQRKQQQSNKNESQVSKSKVAEQQQQQYGDDYEDDFQSPQKQQEGIQPKELIQNQNIKCLNDYMKGTSYARKNKPNLEPFNNKEYYTYIFQQLIENRKVFIFDSAVAKAIMDFGRELMDEDAMEDDLKMSIQTIKEEMFNDYASKLQQDSIDPRTILILPFSFQNEFNLRLIEFMPEVAWFRPVLGKEIDDEETEAKFNSVLEGLMHIFEIEAEPQLQPLTIPAQSQLVLQTFDKELPCLLTLFAMHYEQQLKQPMEITQYTVERFFYTAHVLKPFYQAIETSEEELTKFYQQSAEKFATSQTIQILPLEVNGADPNYEAVLQQNAIQAKNMFLTNKKLNTLLVMFQVLIFSGPQQGQEGEQSQGGFQKIVLYCSMEKTQPKPTITYYIVTKDDLEKENASTLFDIASEGDDPFEVQVFMDFTRHNGLSQYSDWTLPVWARAVQKRKLTPVNAFRAMTFALSPYFITYKQQD